MTVPPEHSSDWLPKDGGGPLIDDLPHSQSLMSSLRRDSYGASVTVRHDLLHPLERKPNVLGDLPARHACRRRFTNEPVPFCGVLSDAFTSAAKLLRKVHKDQSSGLDKRPQDV